MQKYTSHKYEKVSLRLNLRQHIPQPYIIELYGGKGLMYTHCWNDTQGVVFEKDPKLIDTLATVRPSWRVYQGDTVKALQAGVCSSVIPQHVILDCDPFGSPWPAIEAYIRALIVPPIVLGLAVTDGAIQKVQLTGGWDVDGWSPHVLKYGNDIYDRYLFFSKMRLEALLKPQGYTLISWHGVYGDRKHVAYYAAIFSQVNLCGSAFIGAAS